MKFKPNIVYYIQFQDHSMDSKDDKPMLCEVWGKCLRDYEDRVIMCSWELITEDKSTREDNQTRYTILKSCILKKKTLT